MPDFYMCKNTWVDKIIQNVILQSSTENKLLLAFSVQLIENIFFVASDNLTKDLTLRRHNGFIMAASWEKIYWAESRGDGTQCGIYSLPVFNPDTDILL